MTNPPLITAIVLNYKTPKNTVACVRALKNQTIADKVEILVIDNHSDDDSIGIIRNRLSDMPGVRILESAENIGYGNGNAIGLKQATSPYVLIINPDNELQPDALEIMFKEMEAHPDIGIVAPKLVHEDGTIRDSARAFPTLSDTVIKRTFLARHFHNRMDRYLQRKNDPNTARDVDWVVGACMLIRHDLLAQIGGFDPRFFLFFEDMDLCRRCWNAGFRVHYLPKAIAGDRKRRLSEGNALSVLLKKTGRIHAISAIQYFWKWR
ncbi:glycosyltransferase family 2 protein [Candidatus Peribacteria bacterium]|nr:MAG: glycosyltransferase family 2 protein [Candidatus Peribacteria bacterium]